MTGPDSESGAPGAFVASSAPAVREGSLDPAAVLGLVAAQGDRLWSYAPVEDRVLALHPTEAAVLLASVYRKLGLQVALIFVKEQNASRGEALLGISMIKSGGKGNPTRDELRSNLLVLDTSQIGTFSYETAVANGAAKFRDPKHAGNLSFIAHFDAEPGDAMRRVAEMQGYFWIDLARARADGVLPIPEFDFPSARR